MVALGRFKELKIRRDAASQLIDEMEREAGESGMTADGSAFHMKVLGPAGFTVTQLLHLCRQAEVIRSCAPGTFRQSDGHSV